VRYADGYLMVSYDGTLMVKRSIDLVSRLGLESGLAYLGVTGERRL
jgi:hypothetical protein